ncbi:MAG: hypothetical protein V4617_03715 [Gemmatimonadota bacterium]
MTQPNRVRQFYGYTVCLVAVVTSLLSINGVVDNAIRLSDPVASASEFSENISSFDAWMVTRGRYNAETKQDTASAETLRRRYEAVRSSQIAASNFRARRGLITQSIVLAMAIGLFATHWRWLRRPRPDDSVA